MKKLLEFLGLVESQLVETKVLQTGLVCKIYKNGKIEIQ